MLEFYLFLAQLVWQVRNHDLSLAWHTVLWRTSLLGLLWLLILVLLRVLLTGISDSGSLCRNVGGFGQWENLAGNIGWLFLLSICLTTVTSLSNKPVSLTSSRARKSERKDE